MEQNYVSPLPLLPKSALEYFSDGNSDNKLYLRATRIRNCLENIVETIFVHIVDVENKREWKKKDLNGKLELLKNFFPDDIKNRLHDIRKVGNKGAHQSGHKNLNEININLTLNDLSKICEWTIFSYFKKNGFVEHPWILTVFSTLPPIYRVRILEELLKSLNIDRNELLQYQVVDRLAMAYLKNRERVKSINFIQRMYDEKMINELFKEQMLDKLESLWNEIDNLPISTNIEQTKMKLDRILSKVKKEEESLFITLFTAIISQES